ncbi:MAG: alpha/beta hydrolase, partial [Bacteroidia bacterium]
YAGKNINAGSVEDSLNYWVDKITKGDTSYNAKYRRGLALAPAYVFDKKYIPVIAERLTQSNSQLNGLIWSDMIKMNFDCFSKLINFQKRVLIIQGKQDIIEEKTAFRAHEAFKNSKIVLLDNCKHYGWLDSETIYLKEVETLITQK